MAAVKGDLVKQTIAGGAAGFVEVSLMYPLDVIKTRFQIQHGKLSAANNYSSILDCVQTMARNEGILSFYKGIIPPLIADTPKRALKFVSFAQFDAFFSNLGFNGISCITVAGLCSGVLEGTYISGFERVKIQLQANRSRMSEQPSTWSCARDIIRQHGVGRRGLMKGLTATQYRDGIWNCLYFAIYHQLKDVVIDPENPSVIRQFSLGFVASTLASVSNVPFDVAKSRIQGPQPTNSPDKYQRTMATIRTVYKEEGITALYKGLVPKVLRLGPGGAVMFVVYEAVSSWLQAETVESSL